MARHLLRKHSSEQEVAIAKCHSPSSKKRQLILEGLRRKGNFHHNIEVLETGQGEIVTYRQPSEPAHADEYLPCNLCFAFYKKKNYGNMRNIVGKQWESWRPARIPADLARDMILNGWDEEPIGGIDSESDISDVEDPDYCPPGHVRPSGNQPAPAEQDQSDTEESSESSEEEMDIVSNRMSRKGSYWAELPPTQAKTPSHNLLRSRSGPAPGLAPSLQ
ncbi:hypothetical protein F7725_018255 [Dissostichus mawsoni]|uniref:Uncharacterized protein n=1 Tax=Dissostichus mawsoni TaxID=36200 RepID=A0A7J5XTU6_DISMA|nr:hypothetical protein F7725_018255 [Dissostichus mawsoni]